ncbi:hypothetical protein M378DRAFT_156830, partial [Amanita muscaria Koide BX008]
MARLVYHTQSPFKGNSLYLKPWIPSAGVWGVGVGLYALYFLSVTPLVKREFLTKIPLLGNYYQDKTPQT